MNNKHALTFLFLILLSSTVFSARIYGNIFEWYSLELLSNVIVDINSVPEQTLVSKDGSYSFELPPGDYRLHAEYMENNELKYVADENISITSEGEFVIDLIMFPALEENLDDSFDEIENIEEVEPSANPLILVILAGAILIMVVTVFIEVKRLKEKKLLKKKEEMKKIEEKPEPQLDEYAKEVLNVLQKSGNRLTQKELREKISSVGEAKISLILTELEAIGYVKKIKKGRGNIIILKKPVKT